MYSELLSIKHHRERTTARALARQRALVEQQVQVVHNMEAKLACFHDARVTREREAFADIQDQLVTLQRIEDMNRMVASMLEQEALLQSSLVEEQETLRQRRAEMAKARQEHLRADKACEKFERFVEQQHLIEARALALREDYELEEVASTGFVSRARVR